jgi:hypothetical protein
MAAECADDLLEAFTCLLSHGVTQVIGNTTAYARSDGYHIYEGLQLQQHCAEACEAARCLITALQRRDHPYKSSAGLPA